MSELIRVEGVYKRYRLGTINQGTLYRDLQSWWARKRGKEDPNSKISEHPHHERIENGDEFWALRDVSFSVKAGETVGIIGRNGAGKSTLLKILSRTTSPTIGHVKLRGRMSSLLEVGTGFHPELTGRENVFLNGAILGMSRQEVRKKFDDIVAYSEIADFIDTPVKRYSSGMYVRLAFAVAAHLESEILVLDEVLAVGDAQFQKKCLGKMREIVQSGRTILFVSHSMHSIRAFCDRVVTLHQGTVAFDGDVHRGIDTYLANLSSFRVAANDNLENRLQRTSGAIRFDEIRALDEEGKANWRIPHKSKFRLKFSAHANKPVPSLGIYIALQAESDGDVVTNVEHLLCEHELAGGSRVNFEIEIDTTDLRPGAYVPYIALGNKECDDFYDVVDANVDVPTLIVESQERNPHQRMGYFNMSTALKNFHLEPNGQPSVAERP